MRNKKTTSFILTKKFILLALLFLTSFDINAQSYVYMSDERALYVDDFIKFYKVDRTLF